MLYSEYDSYIGKCCICMTSVTTLQPHLYKNGQLFCMRHARLLDYHFIPKEDEPNLDTKTSK